MNGMNNIYSNKKYFRYCFCCGVFLLELLSGCSQESGLQAEIPIAENVPIAVCAALSTAEIDTRASVTEEMKTGSLGIFRLAENDYTALYNVKYEKTSDTALWSSTTTIYVGAEFACLCAYAPYNSVEFAENSTVATLEAQEYKADKDMRYATTGGATIWKLTPQADFTLIHSYARLTLAITRMPTYPSTKPYLCAVTKVVVEPGTGGSKIATQRTKDIATNAETTVAEADNYIFMVTTALKTSGIVSGATDNSGVDMLLPPQTLVGGVKLTLTVDGADYAVTVPADRLSILTAGSHYTVKIDVKGFGLQVEDVTIDKAWTSTSVGSGDYNTGF